MKPTIVCLCGSSKHPEIHMRVMMDETLAGRIVIPMGLYGHADFPAGAKAATNDGDESTAVKQMLDALHHRKIDVSDEVLVVRVDGYIGSSTRREIEYAESNGKPVRYFDTKTHPMKKKHDKEMETCDGCGREFKRLKHADEGSFCDDCVAACAELTDAAFAHVESIVEKADHPNPAGPMWNGWAVREAFIAGAEWQKKKKKGPPTT